MKKEVPKKKKVLYGVKLFFAAVFILGSMAFFFYTIEQDKEVAPKAQVSSKTVSSAPSGGFYVKLNGKDVIVYRADHSVFEYTDLNREILPDALVQELLNGKYFQNEGELYEFLETYTS